MGFLGHFLFLKNTKKQKNLPKKHKNLSKKHKNLPKNTKP